MPKSSKDSARGHENARAIIGSKEHAQVARKGTQADGVHSFPTYFMRAQQTETTRPPTVRPQQPHPLSIPLMPKIKVCRRQRAAVWSAVCTNASTKGRHGTKSWRDVATVWSAVRMRPRTCSEKETTTKATIALDNHPNLPRPSVLGTTVQHRHWLRIVPH